MTAIDAMNQAPSGLSIRGSGRGFFLFHGHDPLRRNGPQLRRNRYDPRARKRQTYKSLVLAPSLLRGEGLRD